MTSVFQAISGMVLNGSNFVQAVGSLHLEASAYVVRETVSHFLDEVTPMDRKLLEVTACRRIVPFGLQMDTPNGPK